MLTYFGFGCFLLRLTGVCLSHWITSRLFIQCRWNWSLDHVILRNASIRMPLGVKSQYAHFQMSSLPGLVLRAGGLAWLGW